MKRNSSKPGTVGRTLLARGPLAEQIFAFDWSASPMGSLSGWPTSLRTAVSILLNSRVPMCIWWGAELRQIHNAAFASNFGGTFRAGLGAPARDIWSGSWDAIGPRAEAVLKGGDETVEIPLSTDHSGNTNSSPSSYAFSYSPIPDDSGGVGGVLVTLYGSHEGDGYAGVGAAQDAESPSGAARGFLADAVVVVAIADERMRGYVEGVLSQRGARITTVPDGERALSATRSSLPDLVLADSHAKTRDGVDLLRAIRTSTRLAAVPVILVLSDACEVEKLEAGDNCADDYVTQPFDSRELVMRCEAVLQLSQIRRESDRAVRRSDEQLRLVMDSIPAVVAYMDREERLRYFNEKLCEWTGLSREQLQDRTVAEVLGKKAYATVRPRIEQVLTGQLVSFETELPYRGVAREVEVNWVPDTGPDGEVEGYVTLVHDVSERRRNERQLTDLRDQLSTELEGMILLHKAGTGLIREDDLGSLLSRVVDAALAITGAELGDVLMVDEASGTLQLGAQRGGGGGHTDVVDALRDEVRNWDTALRRGERVIVGDVSAEGSFTDGTRLGEALSSAGIHAMQSTPLTARDGGLIGLLTTYYLEHRFPTDRDQRLLDLLARQATDCIERHQGESALRASEQRYVHLMQSLPIGVYTCDAEGRIQMYNQAAVRMWGREPTAADRWAGWHRFYRPDGTLMAAEDGPMAVAMREGRAAEDRELIVERPDGTRRYVLAHPVPIVDEHGKVSGAVNMLVDITERKQAEETRALLAAIVTSSGDGIISMTLDGTITSWNAGAERLFGYSEREMVGQKVDCLMPVETEGETFRILNRVREGKRVEDLETVRLTKSGERVDVALTVSPVWDESGKIIGASKISRDISFRKRNEAEIRRLNKDLEARVNELQTLLDVAPVGVFIGQDRNCDLISTNRAGAAMLRMPWPSANASLTGAGAEHLGWRFFRNGVQVPANEFPLQRCAQTGEEVMGDLCEFVFDDGSVLHAKLSVSTLRDGDGEPRGCVATMVDVTEQVQNDLALNALNERLRSDVEDMVRLHDVSTRMMVEQDLVVLLEAILDAAMGVCDAPMGTTQLLDDETEELRLVVSRGFDEPFVRYFKTVGALDESVCGKAWRANQRVVTRDVEEERNSSVKEAFREAGVRAVQSTPLISRSGRVMGMFSTHWPEPHVPEERELRMLDLLARQAADAIERSHSDAVLRHLNVTLEDRVRERTTELEEHRLQLRKLAADLTTAEQRERRRLAALLHDDLQQLLVSAKMMIGGVSRANKVSEMMDACARTDKLIQESIDAARDMSRQLRPPVLYEDGLLPALEWLALDMEKKHGLVVTVDTDDAVEPEDHDLRALMFESARELLLNVVKYAGVKEATIEAVSPEDGLLQLSVNDPGRGFELSALAGGGGEGGFGLFSIRERLAAIGGRMTIESGLGEGTTVTLEAPLYTEERLEMTLPQPEPGHPVAKRHRAGESGEETRVLVVDDHVVVRQGIATLIDEIPDFVVVGEASDGFEAIELMSEHHPDVVLMDVNMPRMNGIEATRRIHSEWPDVVIVGLSVQEDDATAKSVLEAGATRFMSKASSADEIMALMREVLARK